MESRSAGTEIPQSVRMAAEASMDQARRAFEEAMTAAQRTVDTLEGNATAMQAGAREAGRMMLSYAGDVVDDAFALVQGLVKARDPQTIMTLQQDFLRRQMEKAGERTRRMTETAMKGGFGFKSL